MHKALLVTCLIALPWTQAGALASVDLDLAGLSPEDSGRAIFVAADRHNSDYVDMQVELEMILRSSRGAANRRLLRIKQLEIPKMATNCWWCSIHPSRSRERHC